MGRLGRKGYLFSCSEFFRNSGFLLEVITRLDDTRVWATLTEVALAIRRACTQCRGEIIR